MGLTIALNRGRILKSCLPLFARVGIEPTEDMLGFAAADL